MKKKKLIYIGNKLSTGNPTTMSTLCAVLKDQGHEVQTYGSSSNKIIRLFQMLIGIIKHLKSDYLLIDTYSTWNFYYAYFGSLLARIVGLKYINILHGGDLPNRLKHSPKLSKQIFKNAKTLIAPSGYLAEEFENEGYAVTQIPNPIAIENYEIIERRFDTPKLLWVRALQELYNPQMAIRTLKGLQKVYPNATLSMVGPDKDGSLQDCKNLVDELNLRNSVDFTGYQTKEQWVELSRKCNVFLNTTNYDNAPVSVLEAMALGLPVISTNVGGMPYLIENGKTGILVDKNNHEAMAVEILNLFEHPNKAIALAKAARLKAEESDAKRVGELWNKLLSDAS